MAIRQSTLNELRRAVKNYNAKITRLDKIFVDTKLPEKASVKNIKDMDPREVRKQINKLKRFSRRKAEQRVKFNGIYVTQFEKKEMQIALRTVNTKRTIRKKQGFTTGITKKITPQFKTMKQFQKFQQVLNKEARADFQEIVLSQYKDNYFKALSDTFGSGADEIIELLEKEDAKTIFELGKKYDLLGIDYPYEPEETEKKREALKNEWTRRLSEKK